MFSWFKKRKVTATTDDNGLREVPDAVSYKHEGDVIYNMLDPAMQQFLGRCIGAIKKAGIRARGTGQFSVLIGDDQQQELQLDNYWTQFAQSPDESVFQSVVDAARSAVGD